MTTTTHQLRNEYGIDSTVVSFLGALMTSGKLRYQLKLFSLRVAPINGKDYIKEGKARVFDVEEAIEVILNKPTIDHRVSVFQVNKEIKMREKAFAQLSKALKTYEKE